MCYTIPVPPQIATLSRDEQPGSLVDRVFKLSLSEFHTSLISSYSLTLQVSTFNTILYHWSNTPFQPVFYCISVRNVNG